MGVRGTPTRRSGKGHGRSSELLLRHENDFSCQTLVTAWTVTHQAPLSMGFFKQEHWHVLLLPPPGDLPEPGLQPTSDCISSRFFTC